MTPEQKARAAGWCEIEILKGKRHGELLLCVDGTLVCGLKDGFGYSVVYSWKEPRERWAGTLECLQEMNDDYLAA